MSQGEDLQQGPPYTKVTPNDVRDRLLYAINQAAIQSTVDEGDKPAQLGDLALKLAQAYLLLDPLVDAQGVNVAAQSMVSAAGSAAGTLASQAASPPAPADGQAHGTVKRGAPTGQHQQPPAVLPGKAAQVIDQMHQGAENVMKGARGSRPLPKPRPSG